MESLAPLAWRFIGRVGDSLTKAMRSLRALKTIRSYATPMGALGRTPAPCFLLPCFLGFASDVDAARKLGAVAAGFDADGYKILCRPIMMQSHRLVDL